MQNMLKFIPYVTKKRGLVALFGFRRQHIPHLGLSCDPFSKNSAQNDATTGAGHKENPTQLLW